METGGESVLAPGSRPLAPDPWLPKRVWSLERLELVAVAVGPGTLLDPGSWFPTPDIGHGEEVGHRPGDTHGVYSPWCEPERSPFGVRGTLVGDPVVRMALGRPGRLGIFPRAAWAGGVGVFCGR